jgi:hypothetical protein
MSERYDKDEVKRRLPFLDLMAHEGIEMRSDGSNFKTVCPFHGERSGSFTVHGPAHDHGHCYGCGWNGDIFDFWRERHGGDFLAAVAGCASLASVSPEVLARKKKQAAVPRMTERKPEREKPALPRLRALTDDEIGALARLRGLSTEGVRAAAQDKRVGACLWPQKLDWHGCWSLSPDAAPCWVVTDSARRVAQFRRLDGAMFKRKDGSEFKSWSTRGASWPLGASEIGGRGAVLLVEGGADALAAYHFLAMFRRLAAVAVCAILGSSNRIADSALPFFRGRRVRIMMDEDEWKIMKTSHGERKMKPGQEAAARWTEQLTAAGAAVETFSLEGLQKKDGSKVKDLNDLAMVDEAAWLDGELRAAFFDFDF